MTDILPAVRVGADDLNTPRAEAADDAPLTAEGQVPPVPPTTEQAFPPTPGTRSADPQSAGEAAVPVATGSTSEPILLMSSSEGRTHAEAATQTVTTSDPSTVATAQTEHSATEAVKDSELWMEDGNLILATPTVHFRVYRGPLIAQSLVFKDMLSLPQPVDSKASSNQCAHCVPCITIPVSDSPEDLRHFLRVFTGQSVFFAQLNPTFHELSALVRLAHKYQCERLLDWCTKYLSRYYHDDLTLWRNDNDVFNPPHFERIHNIGVVNLARLIGADKMLPGALMACCLLGTEIVNGFTREDGTQETLSMDDLARCFLGRAKLVEVNAAATLRLMVPTVAQECSRPEICEPTLQKILAALTQVEKQKVLFNLRWDWSWTPYIDERDTERELCWACYKMLGKQGRQKERHCEIYEKMPEIMGVTVPGWGVVPPPPEPAPVDDAAAADNNTNAAPPAPGPAAPAVAANAGP